MPKPVDYDLSQISTHVITYSDRIQRGTKEDRATPACTAALAEAGLGPVSVAAIPESADILETEIREALEAGARFILVLGGSGFGVGNYAPEVVRSIVEVEIPGIAEQIRAHGLTNTPLSGLSREVVGVTARDSSGALIISSPGSRGGALDTLEVVTPLLAAVFHQLDEQRRSLKQRETRPRLVSVRGRRQGLAGLRDRSLRAEGSRVAISRAGHRPRSPDTNEATAPPTCVDTRRAALCEDD